MIISIVLALAAVLGLVIWHIAHPRSLGRTTQTIAKLPNLLDWVLRVAERLLVIGLICAAFSFGYQLFWGAVPKAELDVVTLVAQNWKAVLLLLIPLFYFTVRTFLDEVVEAFGMKRQRHGRNESEDQRERSE
jgi:TRAP-type C4-dicarboxylate transport system permease large subunit